MDTQNKAKVPLNLVLIGILVVAIVVAGIIFLSKGSDGVNSVVARVNGEEISESEFEFRVAQVGTQSGAAELTKEQEEQVLSQMIDEELLIQDAEAQGITASDASVEVEYNGIVQNFESQEAFETQLKQDKITSTQLRSNIRDRLILDQYVAQIQLENSITATEEEIQALYDQSVAGGEDVPPIEEVRDQVENFVIQQKLTSILETKITALRTDAEIEILL